MRKRRPAGKKRKPVAKRRTAAKRRPAPKKKPARKVARGPMPRPRPVHVPASMASPLVELEPPERTERPTEIRIYDALSGAARLRDDLERELDDGSVRLFVRGGAPEGQQGVAEAAVLFASGQEIIAPLVRGLMRVLQRRQVPNLKLVLRGTDGGATEINAGGSIEHATELVAAARALDVEQIDIVHA